ncbi:energy-coupling factor transport system permease protein [Salinibacillus kushneri]|uniref:Energy-coupling factor transport system permease protein n=1 Tax=Salinibacillus kushneri TaxID=237682 RepID=A0A1H9ZFW1_9BACI|nr:energy-coupling factor transporter transmembrane component T [Salinibacillus kushneri]SES80482.1 energy-coupling factor transport system permease protein [Salinibacillus kushneri]
MSTMTLYVEKNSILHNTAPLTKVLYVMVSIAITYLIPEIAFVLSVAIITLLLLILGKVFRKIVPILGLSIILILSIIIVQGFFHPQNQTILFSIGFVTFYKEGLSYAALLTLRVMNMIMSFGILILTTKHDELVEAMIKKGLSPKIGYVLLSVLQLIPQMRTTMAKITDAQRSRGMETEGSLLVRMKAFFPLIGPVVLNSINITRERAIALEVRGFSSNQKRSFLNISKEYRYQTAIQVILWLTLAAAIVWRILTWLS